MMTTQIEFNHFLDAPEGSRFEFKEAKQNFSFGEIVKYCVALANEGGGKIILGVTDKRPRRVVGSQAFAEPGRTEGGLYERLHHRVPIEEYFHEGKRVLIFHVPTRPPGSAWSHNGVFWMRAGDSLVGMSDDQLRAIHAETGPDFSAEICSDATIEDLSPEAIQDFRNRWAKKANQPRILNFSNEQTLIDAELMMDEGITYAALVLFGRSRSLGRLIGQVEVVFEYRSTEATGPAQDRVDNRMGFFLFQDDLWNRIDLRNDKQSYQDGLFRYEIPTFDEMVIREAVLNAVCHRDYRLGGSIFIRQYPKRLEVVSPGGFPAGVTPENILDQQNPRNRRLAEAFARCGLVERSGQGMNLIFERSIVQSKPLPDFKGTSDHEVRLTLHGTVGNPAFIRFLEKVGQERLQSFNTYDFLVLDHLQHGRSVPETLKPSLSRLVGAGIVEAIGRGRGVRYILSRSIYKYIGEKGTYTRQKGLDRDTNKALLVKHIKENAGRGARLEEFQQVLPSLSRYQIQTLLRELKKDRKIIVKGRTRAARWYPD
jgi:ATP-dependent DNA helicase RecG